MTRDELANSIDDAFSDVPAPHDDLLVDWSRVRPGHEPLVRVRENWLGGLRRKFDTIQCLTAWYGEDFNYFSQEAVHYLLPGYMNFILTKPAATDFGGFDGTVEYIYRQTLDPPWSNSPEFSRAQSLAISRWAGFVHLHLDEYDVDDSLQDLFPGPTYAEKLRTIQESFLSRA